MFIINSAYLFINHTDLIKNKFAYKSKLQLIKHGNFNDFISLTRLLQCFNFILLSVCNGPPI